MVRHGKSLNKLQRCAVFFHRIPYSICVIFPVWNLHRPPITFLQLQFNILQMSIASCSNRKASFWFQSRVVPLQGIQLGAPPLKISHRNRVLLGTSSSVHDVPSRPLLQQSSLLIPDMYRTWHLPFLPCWSQQLPPGKIWSVNAWHV